MSFNNLLSEFILTERRDAIHDVLVNLTETEIDLYVEGEKLAHEPFGTECYFDFIARVEGDPWPDETQS